MANYTPEPGFRYLTALQYIADKMGIAERFDTDSKTLSDSILGYWKTQKAALEEKSNLLIKANDEIKALKNQVAPVEKSHLIETLYAFIATQKIDLSICAAQREQLMTEIAKLRYAQEAQHGK